PRGANRLASNSLLEALVFAYRASAHARAAIARDRAAPPAIRTWDPGAATDSDEAVVVTQNWDEIRRFMWNYVGIVRSDRRLARARQRIASLQEEIRQYYWPVLPPSALAQRARRAAQDRDRRRLHHRVRTASPREPRPPLHDRPPGVRPALARRHGRPPRCQRRARTGISERSGAMKQAKRHVQTRADKAAAR